MNTYRLFIATVAVATITVFCLAWRAESECAQLGGVRLRPVLGGFKCYDAKTLQEVKDHP